MKYLFLTFLIFVLYSCSSSENGIYKKSTDTKNNLQNNIPDPWYKINAESSDFALANSKTKSFFLFNSACRKNEGSSLSALTSSILTGIENLKIVSRLSNFYQEREAVEVVASGKLDGIERYFKIITIQKNNCIYDYVLISTNQKNIEQDSPALKDFLQRIILQ
jgi:hypothetical protein